MKKSTRYGACSFEGFIGIEDPGGLGRRAFAKLTDYYEIEAAFGELVDGFLLEYDSV